MFSNEKINTTETSWLTSWACKAVFDRLSTQPEHILCVLSSKLKKKWKAINF